MNADDSASSGGVGVSSADESTSASSMPSPGIGGMGTSNTVMQESQAGFSQKTPSVQVPSEPTETNTLQTDVTSSQPTPVPAEPVSEMPDPIVQRSVDSMEDTQTTTSTTGSELPVSSVTGMPEEDDNSGGTSDAA